MNKTGAQKLKLGIFVVVSTALFVIAVYLIGQGQDMFKKTFTISAYFQNVNGLQKGSNVRYSGIDIGTVSLISMVNDSTIQVGMNIEEKIISHIKKDAIATIGSDGLVGNMIVNIVPGPGVAPPISNGDIIESYSKIGADDILSTLSMTNENAAILMADLLKITDKMIKGKGPLGVLLNDTLMAQDLRQSIVNLKRTSYGASKAIGELNELISSVRTDDETILGVLLNDSVSGTKLKNVIGNLETSTVEIDTVINQMNAFVEQINTSEGALNYLVHDSTLVNELKSTIRNIDEGTDRFNQNMEALKHNFLFRAYFRKLEREKRRNEKK